MKNLPKAKGVLEDSLGREERRDQKIGEITKMVMNQIPPDVLAPAAPATATQPATLPAAPAPQAEPGVPRTTPAPMAKREQITEAIVEGAKSYQSEATRMAEKSRAEELERQQKQKKAAKTKLPTSIWIPEAAKKDILNLNTRTFDHDVKINLRGLVLFALKTLQPMPDSKIAEVMKEFDIDERRKSTEDEES